MEDCHSSDEEEVFFGSLSVSEMLKRRPVFNTPNTSRPPRLNQISKRLQGGLPDVLATANTSTPLTDKGNDCSAQNHLPLNDSIDDVIIIDASENSNSVITLSDDESFLKHENECSNDSPRAEGENESCISETTDKNNAVEINQSNLESFPSRLNFVSNVNNSVIQSRDQSISDIENEKNFHDKSVVETEITESVSTIGSCSSVVGTIPNVVSEEEEELESDLNNTENENLLNYKSVNNDCNDKLEPTSATHPLLKRPAFANDFISNSIASEGKSLNGSPVNNSKHGNSVKDNSYSDYFVANQVGDLCKVNSIDNNSSSLVHDIDEFIGNSDVFVKSPSTIEKITATNVDQGTAIQSNSQNLDILCNSSALTSKDSVISSFVASKFLPSKVGSENQKNVNIGDGKISDLKQANNNSFDMSRLSNFEFSLNGVTDSILNISHGSSLPSPPNQQHSGNILYEDISCDGEQLGNITTDLYNNYRDQEDLHMSVDEVDFHREGFSSNFISSGSFASLNSINTSLPSEYKSSPSAQSSYSTACDKTCSESHPPSQSNSFQKYRDVSNDLDFPPDIDAVSIKSNEDNVNSADFEMVVQERQNSFNDIPISKMSEKNGERPKAISKLPVYQNSKSLLRPPKLCMKSDALKTSSYKFARQISHANKSSNAQHHEVFKISGPSTANRYASSPSNNKNEKTVAKELNKISTPKQYLPTPKQFPSLTKSKIPSHLQVSKTPQNKTPAKSTFTKTPTKSTSITKPPAKSTITKTPAQNTSGIPRAVNSDSKVKRYLTPLKDSNVTLGSTGKNIPSKTKYKNIVSPIQAYIRGSPPITQRKAIAIDEENIDQKPNKNASPMKSASGDEQKLKYETVQEQENVNPNAKRELYCRDTLPCKVLEPSLQVFWKEREKPEPHPPKMGEKCIKALSGPPKSICIVHEGRVNESPKSKGILVPNQGHPSSTSDISNADDLPSGSPGGRISVRVQTTVDLL